MKVAVIGLGNMASIMLETIFGYQMLNWLQFVT